LRENDNAPELLVSDKETFSESLLPINETRNQMMSIERLAGAKDKFAGTVANELIKDFQLATSYPPEERDVLEPDELKDIVNELAEKIASERIKANEKSEEEES
jgi:intracellular multiplication protein IcmO